MEYKISIDIGIIRIKVLAIEYENNEIFNLEEFAFSYPNSIVENIASIGESFDTFFLDNIETIENQLIKISDKFPIDAKYYLSIASFPGDIYFKRMYAKNKKRLKIATNIFQKQISKIDMKQDYSVIEHNKISKYAYVLFYSYSEKWLNSIIRIFKNNQMLLQKIEFDIVNLLNIIDLNYDRLGNFLFVDIGYSKTNFIHYQDSNLIDFGSSKLATNIIIDKLSRKKKDSVIDVINHLIGTKFKEYSSTAFDIFFQPLITGIKKDMDNFKIDENTEIVLSGGISNHREFYDLFTKYFDHKVSKLNPLEKIYDLESNKHNNSIFGNAAGLILR